jgi:hypothetical protein
MLKARSTHQKRYPRSSDADGKHVNLHVGIFSESLGDQSHGESTMSSESFSGNQDPFLFRTTQLESSAPEFSTCDVREEPFTLMVLVVKLMKP